MTIQETRQLGIEFERRVQTMIPQKEILEKLDSETIYSFLNQYQDKLIHDLYRTVDQIPTSNIETYIETLLNSMMKTVELNEFSGTGPVYRVGSRIEDNIPKLPEDFGLYIKSYTNVNKSYRLNGETSKGTIPNELISVKDVNKLISRPQDSLRILRSPIVWLADENGLGALYDRYTEPVNIQLEYYKLPNYMNPLTSTRCELPMEMFEQLVSGAVDLYVQYVSGAEANRRRQQEQAQQQRNNQKNEQE